jgi:hypothetical protein
LGILAILAKSDQQKKKKRKRKKEKKSFGFQEHMVRT